MALEKQKRDPSGRFLPVDANTIKPPRDPNSGKFISPYEVLRKRVANQTVDTAVKWFARKIKELGIPNPMSMSQGMRAPIGSNNATAMIGQMFLYYYDPKHAEKMPFYDKFPLIFMFEFRDDGWLGINTHYLSPKWRFILLAKLMEHAQLPMSPTDRLALDWEMLGNIAKFPECRPAVKRYLANHVRSKLKRIDPIDWATAIALPMEAFEKKTKQEVWRDSAKKIREARSKGK